MNKQIQYMLLMPVIFFALLFVYTKVAGPLPLTINSVVTQKSDSFSVTGEGKVSIVPDLARVTVGVQTQGTSTKVVQDQLNQKINAVSQAIKELGIEAKDIQTTNYNLYPTYDYQGGTQRITGFQASSNLNVKVRDLDKTNTVVDAATHAGANSIGGITFDVEDRSKAENEAREKAFAEAKAKAVSAAQIAGFTLGKVINYTESAGAQVRPMAFDTANAQAKGGAETATQVEPGSQEIELIVTISYQID